MILVPLLYGGFYLYANWDPYENLDQVPAALVVADKGTTTDGRQLHVGKDVGDELLRKGKFDWQRVSADEADDGVRSGRYTFAVTLPADFSEAIASSAKFEARQGMLVLTTNDANSYVGSTIGHKVAEEVRRAVASKSGAEAADRLLVGLSTIQEKTQEAANGSTKLADGAKKASDGAAKLADGERKLLDGAGRLVTGTAKAATGTKQLETGAQKIAGGLGALRDSTRDLPSKSAQLASGARQVADGNTKLAQAVTPYLEPANQAVAELQDLRDRVQEHLRAAGMSDADIAAALAPVDENLAKVRDANAKLQTGGRELNRLAAGSKQVADGADRLAAAAPRLTTGIGQAADGAGRLSSGATQLTAGMDKLSAGTSTLRDGLGKATDGADTLRDGNKKVADGSRELSDALAKATGQIPHPDDPTRALTAKVIGDPVAVRTVGQATAETYGEGLAPFFLGLALWVGAFTLFMLVRPLSNRALAAGQAAWRVALGGWLPSAVLGSVQAALLFTFAVTAIGVEPAHPVATFAFLLLTALTFTAIVHGLNAYFGPTGRFIALVLLVLQLTTAGGTFPWQTTPSPLHPLHAALPLSYVVDGLRHLLYGGSLSGMGVNVAMLVGYLFVGLTLSTLAGRKQRMWSGSRLQPELVL
jgi:putative membrane protein